MLSRISGPSALFDASLPSSDASGTATGGAASVPTAESQAAPAALPPGDEHAMHDEPAAQDAGNIRDDPEAAAAHRFWLPNDAWSSITEFLPRRDILSLRTVSHEMTSQVDDAIQSVRIRPETLPRFLDSDSFKNVRNLDASLLDQATLDQLITHLAAHPRAEMTIRLGPPRISINTHTLLGLSTLSLKGLVLELALAGPDDLNALAACRFPVEFLDMGIMTHEQLVAASSLPTLRRLATSSHLMTEEVATRFAAHRALEALSIHIFRATSSQTLQLLASIPTLRELHVNGRYGNDLDVPTARALAANASLKNLRVWSYGPGLNDDGFAALSRSQSLTTLRVPLHATMRGLADMTSVRNLVFDSPGTLPYPRLDAATSRSIAALPALESIAFPDMKREPDALTAILKDSVASKLEFWSSHSDDGPFFNADERTALLANTKLKAWEFVIDDLQASDRDILLNHPTIAHVKLGSREYTRAPDGNVPLTLRQA